MQKVRPASVSLDGQESARPRGNLLRGVFLQLDENNDMQPCCRRRAVVRFSVSRMAPQERNFAGRQLPCFLPPICNCLKNQKTVFCSVSRKMKSCNIGMLQF